nr:hypothetical protein [Tanacetum cinerariifolium]
MEEIMITTTAFIRGEATAASKKKGHASWKPQDQSKRHSSDKRSDFRASNGTEEPLAIEAEMSGHVIHRMYIDGGSSMEILYEQCFNRLRPEIKSQMVPATTSLTGFSGETIWPLGQLRLLVTIGDATHSTKAWMNFMVVKSMSPYNVALHPDFPDQEVVIGGSLSDKGRIELCSVLKKNLDIFACQPSDMTGVPRSVAKHRLNIREGYTPVRIAILCRRSLCGYPFKCFLDAYKGYHQIQLAEADEENTAFHTGQRVYCYTKMPFGLKNAGATYQRLMDKAFERQVGRNIEVYVDDLVVKSHTEAEMVRDIEETFRTLRKINMKLNPKKCSFGLAKGVFLGKISAAVSDLKKCIKKSDFIWTAEAEQAFQQLKQHLSDLPLLVAPNPQEELIMYLSATYGAVSAVNVDSKLVANQVLETYVAKEENMIKYLEIVRGLVSGFTTFSISQVPRSKNKQADALSKIASTSFAHLSKQVLVEVLENKSIKEKEVAAMIEEDADYLKEGILPGDNKEARKLCLKARQYELRDGVLYRQSFLTPWLRCVGPLQADYIHRPVTRHPQQPLTPITAPWPFYKWGIDIAGPFSEGPGKVKFVIVSMDYFTKWVEAKAVATITGGQVKRFVWDNIVCRFERANQSLGKGIKARLGEEIGMPTYHTAVVDVVNNDKELRLNLDLLEERRERAAVCEARAKSKMMKYYNARVCGVAFKPGDFVYRSNDASHAVAGGKLGPKWEGPYEVTEALGNEAYKLRSTDGTVLPRTWNVTDLKRCYL